LTDALNFTNLNTTVSLLFMTQWMHFAQWVLVFGCIKILWASLYRFFFFLIERNYGFECSCRLAEVFRQAILRTSRAVWSVVRQTGQCSYWRIVSLFPCEKSWSMVIVDFFLLFHFESCDLTHQRRRLQNFNWCSVQQALYQLARAHTEPRVSSHPNIPWRLVPRRPTTSPKTVGSESEMKPAMTEVCAP
jgi:hypothetical protein